jgi:HAE1 family hydrophobic/amphiphilic exporter-1
MDEAMTAVETEVKQVRGVTLCVTTVGGSFLGSSNSGNLYVRIAPHEERVFSFGRLWHGLLALDPGAAWRGNYSQRDVMTEVRARLRPLKELRCPVRNARSFNLGGGNFDIDFAIRGPELEPLAAYAEALRVRVSGKEGQPPEIGGIVDADTTLKLDKPELRAVIDRERAADLGVDPEDVASALRLMVGGDQEVSRFMTPAATRTTTCSYASPSGPPAARGRATALRPPPRRGPRALDNLVKLVRAAAPSRIDRLDRERQVSLRASVGRGFALQDRLLALRRPRTSSGMPPGLHDEHRRAAARSSRRSGSEFLTGVPAARSCSCS